MCTHIKRHVQEALIALFLIAENWTQSKYLSTVRDKLCNTSYSTNYYAVEEKNKTTGRRLTQLNLIKFEGKKRHERICNA